MNRRPISDRSAMSVDFTLYFSRPHKRYWNMNQNKISLFILMECRAINHECTVLSWWGSGKIAQTIIFQFQSAKGMLFWGLLTGSSRALWRWWVYGSWSQPCKLFWWLPWEKRAKGNLYLAWADTQGSIYFFDCCYSDQFVPTSCCIE